MNNSLVLDSIVKNTRKRTNNELECKAMKDRTSRSMKWNKLLHHYDNGDVKEHTGSLTLWRSLCVNQEPRNNHQRELFSLRF